MQMRTHSQIMQPAGRVDSSGPPPVQWMRAAVATLRENCCCEHRNLQRVDLSPTKVLIRRERKIPPRHGDARRQ